MKGEDEGAVRNLLEQESPIATYFQCQRWLLLKVIFEGPFLSNLKRVAVILSPHLNYKFGVSFVASPD